MARTLADLTYFTRCMIEMEPWRYDHGVLALRWREDHVSGVQETKPLRIGVMRDVGQSIESKQFRPTRIPQTLLTP